jgi:hypothetical protein
MTAETKTTLQLSDITAVEFECKKCHRIVSLPLPLKSPNQVPVECDCDIRQHWMPTGSDAHRSLLALMDYIERYANATNEPFVLRFVTTGLFSRASGDKD